MYCSARTNIQIRKGPRCLILQRILCCDLDRKGVLPASLTGRSKCSRFARSCARLSDPRRARHADAIQSTGETEQTLFNAAVVEYFPRDQLEHVKTIAMLELLRDPLWQFIGALLAAITVAVSLWIFVAQRSRKRLLVERIARVPLIAGGSKGIPGIRITFGDRELKSALVVLVRVRCTGNVPIVADDYESPLRLQFEDSAAVLSADAIDTTPIGIPILLTCDGAAATVSKRLLNPGDLFTIRLLVENSKGRLQATARIAGVARLDVTQSPSFIQPTSTLFVMFGLVLFLGSSWFSPAPKSIFISDLRPDEFPYAAGELMGLLFLISGTILQFRAMRRWLGDSFRPYRRDEAKD